MRHVGGRRGVRHARRGHDPRGLAQQPRALQDGRERAILQLWVRFGHTRQRAPLGPHADELVAGPATGGKGRRGRRRIGHDGIRDVGLHPAHQDFVQGQRASPLPTRQRVLLRAATVRNQHDEVLDRLNRLRSRAADRSQKPRTGEGDEAEPTRTRRARRHDDYPTISRKENPDRKTTAVSGFALETQVNQAEFTEFSCKERKAATHPTHANAGRQQQNLASRTPDSAEPFAPAYSPTACRPTNV